ncbi:hypothetical protein [Burkholderia ubonensis]|uniref:hypothetical protein n=1 Tax=Burkholderia ubonensis TaxID=101571 RepID=UPI0007545FA4|nr:hypothetical protein [Burkholderia ubonensis]KVO11754.1 hypothetical protein WJ73_19605 [Burkholderia ubonensis]
MTAGPIIRIETSDFASAFGLVDAAIDRRSNTTAMNCVRLRTIANHRLELFGASSAGQITTDVPMKIMQEGEFNVCVPAEKLAPLIASAADHVKLSMAPNGRLQFESKRTRGSIPMLPGAVMPEAHSPGEPLAEFDSPGIGALIESVAFVSDEKDIREYCQGVWLESDGKNVHAVATNVLMMATNQLAIGVPQFGFMLTEKSSLLLAGFDPERLIIMQDGVVAMRGDAKLHMKKALLKFPAWRKGMPELKNSITFSLAQLREAISVTRFYDSKLGVVRFLNDGDGYQIAIKDGEHEVDFDLDNVEQSGDAPFEHAFKGEQLAKMLARLSGETVTFFWDAIAPRGFLMQDGTWRGIVSRLTL